MTAKQYLEQIFYLEEVIGECIDELEYLRQRAVSPPLQNLCAVKTSGGGASDKISVSTQKIIILETEIREKIKKCVQKKREVESLIERIHDSKIRTVLTKRYVHFKRWKEVAASLGYAETHVYRLHKEGLCAIEKMIANVS